MIQGVSAVLLVIACTLISALTYNLRVPMNGGMYGKRDGPSEYDARSKAVSTMCEMATEVCSAWLAQADPN
nr:IMFamide [Carausius morosus]